MKLLKPTALIAGFAFALSSATFAQGLGSGIATFGSPHNFTDNLSTGLGGPINELPGVGGWNGREEICRVCHVPHDHDLATRYGEVGLLWNHALSEVTYTMYSSWSLDGAIAAQPTGYSKLCLGCHDGTVGIDTFDSYPGGTVTIDDYNMGFMAPDPSDLSGMHPISIVYAPDLDPYLMPVSAPMGGSGTIDDVLENGVLQCSSCHDVHDQPGESVAGTSLLRVSLSSSALCLACHNM